MASKKELKALIKELEWRERNRHAKLRMEKAAFLKHCQESVGPAHLVLPSGAIVPVVVGECNIESPPAGYINVTMVVYPQPPMP